MRVLLIDADSKSGFPNLALMKISAHHKSLGDTIHLQKGVLHPLADSFDLYDKAYISCIFFQSAAKVKSLADSLHCEVILGGSGIDYKTVLADNIEHIMPDYDLYGIDFSMGFTSRGCIRNCPWCIVPKKEGKIRDHAPITEFLHPNHNKVVLLDNNLLASSKWRKTLDFIIEHKLKVSFNQGLDIRLINEENAKLLAECKYYDWRFKNRTLYFAFDKPRIKKAVIRGIHQLIDVGINPHHLMFYVLIAFNTTFDEDYHRYETLMDLGIKPFIMRYNSNEGPYGISKHFARWVNGRYHELFPFKEYNQGNSQEAIMKVLNK